MLKLAVGLFLPLMPEVSLSINTEIIIWSALLML